MRRKDNKVWKSSDFIIDPLDEIKEETKQQTSDDLKNLLMAMLPKKSKNKGK